MLLADIQQVRATEGLAFNTWVCWRPRKLRIKFSLLIVHQFRWWWTQTWKISRQFWKIKTQSFGVSAASQCSGCNCQI